jgi:hypothetical protein
VEDERENAAAHLGCQPAAPAASETYLYADSTGTMQRIRLTPTYATLRLMLEHQL